METSENRILPPYIYLSFYFQDLPEPEAFERVVSACVRRGATLENSVLLTAHPEDARKPFARLDDYPLASEKIDPTQYASLDPDWKARVRGVSVRDAVGVKPGVLEYIQFTPISAQASKVDRHPVHIQTDGWVFDAYWSERDKWRAAGDHIYRVFKEVVALVEPDYAAIVTEDDMLCPTDLAAKEPTLNFYISYMSKKYIGETQVSRAAQMVKLGLVEHVELGVHLNLAVNYLMPLNIPWVEEEEFDQTQYMKREAEKEQVTDCLREAILSAAFP